MLNVFARLVPHRLERFEARLKGVAGFTGSGRFRYSIWSNGHVDYEAELKGLAGVRAEIFVRGMALVSVQCDEGEAFGLFDSRRGAPRLAIAEGDEIEIRQNGAVVLRGPAARL